jgi:hypothetical protein
VQPDGGRGRDRGGVRDMHKCQRVEIYAAHNIHMKGSSHGVRISIEISVEGAQKESER